MSLVMMTYRVQELQKYLKVKKIPSSGAKKDLVDRVKMHQDSIIFCFCKNK